MGFDLGMLLGFLLVSGFALLGLLLLGKPLRPHRPEASKTSTYECGEPAVGPAWFNFNNRFYVIALVFVVFDVEVALVVPVAVVFRELVADGAGLLAFTEMFLFLAVLLVGLVYVWARGDLTWVRALDAGECREVELGPRSSTP